MKSYKLYTLQYLHFIQCTTTQSPLCTEILCLPKPLFAERPYESPQQYLALIG